MTRAIVFSLFGSDQTYRVGALKNIDLMADVYPGFVPWFYVGASVTEEARRELTDRGAVIVAMDHLREDWSAAMWRYYALGVRELDVILFRDCDSRVNVREAAAVEEWLASDKMFHIMRDHEQHNTEILAGLWGARVPAMRTLRRLIPHPLPRSTSYHDHFDQRWLTEKVYPIVLRSAMIHAEFHRYEGSECRPFPSPRLPRAFVGQGFTADDKPRIPKDVPND